MTVPLSTLIVIRKYGLRDPVDWATDCEDQLQRQNRLWNRLVGIERLIQDRRREIFRDDPELARLLAEIEEAEGDDRRALEQRASVRHKELESRFATLLSQTESERKTLVKRARQESGLWWGNYNAVYLAYERARVRALRTGSRLRFRAFDGTGRFRNQIMGGMTVRDLFGGRHQVQAQTLHDDAHAHPVRAERRRRSRTSLTATIYTDRVKGRRTLTWPMVMHRPIPEDARIKEIIVTRKREGFGFRWSAIFICTRAHRLETVTPAARAARVTLGTDEDERGIRIAIVEDPDGGIEHVYLPAAVSDRSARVATLHVRLTRALAEVRERLRAWLATETFPHGLTALAHAAVKSSTFEPLMNLALAWREHPAFRPEWCTELEAWRRTDKRERTEAAGLQRKMFGLRRQFYQSTAKRFAETYGTIALTLTDTSTSESRRLQRLAAISELVEWLRTQSAKTGAQITQAGLGSRR